MNSSLKQRLRSGINVDNTTQQSFLLACYLSTSRGQCDFYEVNSITVNSISSTSSLVIDYDLWTCSKKIIMPNPPSSHSHDTTVSAQLPYDFEFKHVYDGPKMQAMLGAHSIKISLPGQHQTIRSTKNTQLPEDISFLTAEILSDDDDGNDDNNDHQIGQIQREYQHESSLSSPSTNRSLFGVPRLPPKQSTHPSPSWDLMSSVTMTTPKSITTVPTVVPSSTALPPLPPTKFSSPIPSTIAPSTVTNDAQWKEEMLEKMQTYDAHIQSLNALIAQLLAAQQQQQQQQQSSISTSVREPTKCDAAVQSEPPSPCTSDDVHESASMIKSNRNSPPLSSSPKIEQLQHYQQQTPLITPNTRVSLHSSLFIKNVPFFSLFSHLVRRFNFIRPFHHHYHKLFINPSQLLIMSRLVNRPIMNKLLLKMLVNHTIRHLFNRFLLHILQHLPILIQSIFLNHFFNSWPLSNRNNNSKSNNTKDPPLH